MAAASFCGNWAFSMTTYSTSVLFAAPHSFIWSPSALSPSGVKLCQPQTVSLLPVEVNFGAAAAAAGWRLVKRPARRQRPAMQPWRRAAAAGEEAAAGQPASAPQSASARQSAWFRPASQGLPVPSYRQPPGRPPPLPGAQKSRRARYRLPVGTRNPPFYPLTLPADRPDTTHLWEMT